MTENDFSGASCNRASDISSIVARMLRSRISREIAPETYGFLDTKEQLGRHVILLGLGMIMDMAPIILIATPILLPVATQYCGLDPIQFGIMMVLNCGIGLLTPPVGAVLFIGSAVAKRPMEKVVKATLPFYLCMIITLLLVSFWPDVSLIIPKLFADYVPQLG